MGPNFFFFFFLRTQSQPHDMLKFARFIVLCLAVSMSPGHVMRVIDGDTFVLYHVGVPAEERVRLLGVDTPERGEPGFLEAGQFTRAWLSAGPWTLSTCKRDSFGRLLGTVTRGGQNLGDELRQAGLAN